VDVPDLNVERDGCYSDRSVEGFLSSSKQLLVYWTQRYITLHYITLLERAIVLRYTYLALSCSLRLLRSRPFCP